MDRMFKRVLWTKYSLVPKLLLGNLKYMKLGFVYRHAQRPHGAFPSRSLGTRTITTRTFIPSG
jgi:hypothetical protein